MKSRLQNAFIEAGVLCLLKLRKVLFIPSSTDGGWRTFGFGRHHD
jgi:hypothetical protein